MRRNLALCFIVLCSTYLSACAVGPSYERPEIDTGSGWIEPAGSISEPLELDAWWRVFDDPALDTLIARALADNRDVRQSEARVAEVRALRAAARGGFLPTIDTFAGLTRRRQSENGPLPINQIPGLERDQTIYEPGFDALWELDLFGRTRRAVEAAEARLEVAHEERDGLRLSIASEVARAYLDLRGAQDELAAAAAAVDAAERTLALTRERAEAGDVPADTVALAEADTARLRAELPLINARVRAAALSLGVLMGGLPESGLEVIAVAADRHDRWPMPTGERADILRRRPDVRAAERDLAAVTADMGVATAALFPRLTIGARASFQSLATDSLFDSESQAISVAPLISWRLFDGGRIRAQIDVAEARVEFAALGYEKAVVGALADAERALSQYRAAVDSLASTRSALAAAEHIYRSANTRFDAGDVSRLALLEAERRLRDAERAYARAHTQTGEDFIALCKALGGGWPSLEASG